jgi:hypothetical protein
MTEHTDSCTWPYPCVFLEDETCDCTINGKTGYKDEIDRNYADEQGLDAYKPCKYYLGWDNAIHILTKHIENKAAGWIE